jgi:hypothetical protein
MVQKRIDPTSSIARNLKERADQIAAQNRQGSQLVETIKTLQGNANLPQQLKTSVLDASKNRSTFAGLNVPNSVNAVIGQQNRPTIYNSSYNTSANQAINRFQTSLSGLNQYSPSHQGAGVIQRPLMQTQGTFGSGAFDRSQIANAPQSALFIQKQDRLASSTDKLTQSIEKLYSKISQQSRPAAGGGGGGEDGGGGGGFEDFLDKMSRKDRRGLRGGRTGGLLKAGGELLNAGLEGYLNYQQEMATAATDTYSNIASLKGFQQKRFLRNFGDFSAEALMLRSPALATSPTTANLISRVDKLAEQNKNAIDTAETQRELKNIAGAVGQSTLNQTLQGAASGTAGTGFLSGLVTSLANVAAGAPTNNVLMRNELNRGMFSDLYLKNRTSFDAKNLIQQTSQMENAILQDETVTINNLNKYLKTTGARFGSAQSGRNLDVLGNLSRATGQFGTFNTQSYGNIFENAQQAGMRRMAQDLTAEGRPRTFAQVLTRMGLTPGGEDAERIQTQLSAIGGAGAGSLTDKSGLALDRVRQMSFSGRGGYEQLLGQAGLLGRISGGVSAEGNVKKLEEVLGRAVAIGMDNSELGQAFVQNVANVAGQMKTGDIDAVSKLVQNMQRTGGGQLVDFERMQRSVSGLDAARQQNVAVNTYTRENMAAFLSKAGISDPTKAAALNQLTEKFQIKDFSLLESSINKFSKEGLAGIANAPPAIRNLLAMMTPEEAKKTFSKQNIQELKQASLSGLMGMTNAEFKEQYGDIKSIKKKPEVLRRLLTDANALKGVEAGQILDLIGLMSDERNLTAGAVDKTKAGQVEKLIRPIVKKAGAEGAEAVAGGAQAETLILNELKGKTADQIKAMYPNYATKLTTKEMQALSDPNNSKFIEEYRTKSKGGIFHEIGSSEQDLKNLQQNKPELFSALQKAQEQTKLNESLEAPGKTTDEMAKGAVMSGEQAADIGSKFADAFFAKLQSTGGKIVLDVPAKGK